VEGTDGRPIAVLFGTRPEAIKLAPVILELRARDVPTIVVRTGQHRELVDSIVDLFGIEVDMDLDLMRPEQSLDYVLAGSIIGIGEALGRFQPRAVVVQGDTTSSLGASLAAFHRGIPLAHVEAGLRSFDLGLPFPEEMNRRVTSIVARWHFAPTAQAAENLRDEGVLAEVIVTGNTVVDALRIIGERQFDLTADLDEFTRGHRFVLATAHRRESWEGGIAEVARAVRDVMEAEPELRVVFVTHPNPIARGPVEEILGGRPTARVLDALDYPSFLALLQRAALVVSDSGGVQEEGPTLGVPVLVTRSVTERPEGVAAGAVRLVGTDQQVVGSAMLELLRDPALSERMRTAGRGVYGDGRAAERIVDALLRGTAC
jgi:UDP-N-acetylglucosamine 2-epimerase (non-hydrolysing)